MDVDFIDISPGLADWLDNRSGARSVARAVPPIHNDPPPVKVYEDPDAIDPGAAT